MHIQNLNKNDNVVYNEAKQRKWGDLINIQEVIIWMVHRQDKNHQGNMQITKNLWKLG